jgi:protein-tyrosine kinase
MSEIFEALRKAQREADFQGEQPVGVKEAAIGGTRQGSGDPPDHADASPAPRLKPAPVRRRRFGWLQRLRAMGAVSKNGRGKHQPAVLVSASRETAFGEQFRILRTRIEMAGPGTVMITSALDQEGKTLCASNLAVALSLRMGAGVVLVDADLRHPSVAPYFGLRGGPGLVDCLQGDTRWQDCIVKTAYERLSILPAGCRSDRAPELLGSERMGAVMSELKSQYPTYHIVVDAPPLLLTADPMVIARQMDHILLVVRAGVTPRAAVLKAVETIGPNRVFGVILNDATDSFSHYYYYNGRYPSGQTENTP